MAHGAGGTMMQGLIKEIIVKNLGEAEQKFR